MEACCVHTWKRAGSLQENFFLRTSNGGCRRLHLSHHVTGRKFTFAMTRIHWLFPLVLNLFGTMELVLKSRASKLRIEGKASCIRTQSHPWMRIACSITAGIDTCPAWISITAAQCDGYDPKKHYSFTNYNHHTVSQKLDEEFAPTCMHRACRFT